MENDFVFDRNGNRIEWDMYHAKQVAEVLTVMNPFAPSTVEGVIDHMRGLVANQDCTNVDYVSTLGYVITIVKTNDGTYSTRVSLDAYCVLKHLGMIE